MKKITVFIFLGLINCHFSLAIGKEQSNTFSSSSSFWDIFSETVFSDIKKKKIFLKFSEKITKSENHPNYKLHISFLGHILSKNENKIEHVMNSDKKFKQFLKRLSNQKAIRRNSLQLKKFIQKKEINFWGKNDQILQILHKFSKKKVNFNVLQDFIVASQPKNHPSIETPPVSASSTWMADHPVVSEKVSFCSPPVVVSAPVVRPPVIGEEERRLEERRVEERRLEAERRVEVPVLPAPVVAPVTRPPVVRPAVSPEARRALTERFNDLKERLQTIADAPNDIGLDLKKESQNLQKDILDSYRPQPSIGNGNDDFIGNIHDSLIPLE